MSRIKVSNLRQDSATSDNISLDSSGNVAFQAGSASTPSLYFTGDTNTGIYAPGADSVAVVTGGSARAAVDSSGRLLVGSAAISSPKCDPSGIDLSNGNLTIIGGADSTLLTRTDSTRKDMRIGCVHYTNAEEPVIGLNLVSDNSNNAVHIGGGTGLGNAATLLQFYTAANQTTTTGTERMRIENTGVTSIVTTSECVIASTTQGAGTSYTVFTGRYSGTAGSPGSGTASIRIWSNGDIQNTNGSYTQISDAKLKENIVDANSQWDDIKAIRIRNWNFKEETGHQTHRQIGLVAQELEQVCPGLVFETPDRDEDGNETGEVTKGVNQSILYMKAVKALQEAMERIETLETANASQAATIAALDARLTALES